MPCTKEGVETGSTLGRITEEANVGSEPKGEVVAWAAPNILFVCVASAASLARVSVTVFFVAMSNESVLFWPSWPLISTLPSPCGIGLYGSKASGIGSAALTSSYLFLGVVMSSASGLVFRIGFVVDTLLNWGLSISSSGLLASKVLVEDTLLNWGLSDNSSGTLFVIATFFPFTIGLDKGFVALPLSFIAPAILSDVLSMSIPTVLRIPPITVLIKLTAGLSVDLFGLLITSSTTSELTSEPVITFISCGTNFIRWLRVNFSYSPSVIPTRSADVCIASSTANFLASALAALLASLLLVSRTDSPSSGVGSGLGAGVSSPWSSLIL